MKQQELLAAKLKQDLLEGKEPLPGAAQCEEDLSIWVKFLGTYYPNSMIEFGTGSGAFSKWVCHKFTSFATFDNQYPDEIPPNFIKLDIFNSENYLRLLIQSADESHLRPLLLYCDNGNKPLEVEIYAPYLSVGDYLVVHDYTIEIGPEDIPDNFSPVMFGGLTAFFEKVES